MKTIAIKRLLRWLPLLVAHLYLLFGVPSCLSPSDDFGGRSQRAETVPVIGPSQALVSPHLHEKIPPRGNLLWCGTFQMAWNECMRLTGGPLHFDNEPDLVAELNRQEFTRKWVDERNCVAIADLVVNGVYGRIERELKKITTDRDFARYRPKRGLAVRPQDLVAYAYLQADLRFPTPFERLDDQLSFQGTRVSAFGIGPQSKPGQAQLYPQVWVHDYRNRDDFVVELQSQSKGDRLILGRVRPGRTLLETIREVETRLVPVPALEDYARLTEGEKRQAIEHLAHAGDVLIVPKMAFEITRSYDELIGLQLRPADKRIARDLMLLGATQLIRFEMNEKGASLRSVAQMSFTCSAAAPALDRWMVFDGPFLLILQRQGAPLPYFAAWVGDAELLQKAGN